MSLLAESARRPGDLAKLLVHCLNTQDVDGLIALYEEGAVLATPDGGSVQGHAAIRRFYADLLAADPPPFEPGEQHPALELGDLALTTTRLPGGGATAEVARRQQDGTWRWILDRPNVR